MNAKQIENYLVLNYGGLKHCPHKMSKAIKQTSKIFDIDRKKLFHLIVENEPIKECYTHSYGFHTQTGRNIINTFQNYYYNN